MKMRRAVDQSYLLRIWADRAGDPLRATLTPVDRQDARYQFASLDKLVAFLNAAAQRLSSVESADGADYDTKTL